MGGRVRHLATGMQRTPPTQRRLTSSRVKTPCTPTPAKHLWTPRTGHTLYYSKTCNLETCAETLRDEDQTEFFSDDDLDNPYPAVDFDQMMAQGPGAGAQIIDRPGRSSVKKSESGRRLQEGTEQLSMELMEHVESLKTTLDNMSSRLGTRSRSRSHSKTRPSSQYRPSEQ